MRPVVIVVVLPFAQLLVEQVDVVRDATAVQQLIELLVVNSVRAFDLPVEMRRPRPDVDVANIQGLEVPVESRLKLGAIVPSHKEVMTGQVLL